MRNKICHLSSVHAYNDTRIFHKECASLVQAGYDVSLIASVDEGFMDRCVTIIPAGTWSNRYYRFFVTIPRLLLKALREKASIYHFHDPELLLIVPILKLSGATVIYDIHEDYVTSIQQKTYIPAVFRRLIASTLGVVEKSTSALCYQVVAEHYYKDRFPEAIEILNYPLLHRRDNGVVDAQRPDSEAVFDDRYDWCLYTGNVTVDRGALLQLELLTANEGVAVAYIGKCSKNVADAIFSFATREKISSERIKIIGIGSHVPRETIDYYTYSRPWLAGLALFPDTPHYARKELTKLFEYMAAGLPILSSNFPVWKNLVEKNSCGFCVNPRHTDSVTSAIDYLLRHPGEAATMGENGRKAVKERYNWGIEEKKLVAYYKKIITDKGLVSTDPEI